MKKIISIMLCITLFLMAGIPAYAAQSKESTGLEQAILAVKKIITIPSDYKEFEYYLNEENDELANQSSWNLKWKKTDSEDYISVVVSQDGCLLGYSKFYERGNNNGIGKITKDQAKKTVENFLLKARPDIANKMKLEESNQSYSSSHYLTYMFYENDVPVDFMKANFEVDKFTGELLNYSGLNLTLSQLTAKDNIINKDTAKKVFLENHGLELKYHSYYDYSKKTLTVFPAYEIGNQNRVVDAKTGKMVGLYNDYRMYMSVADKKESGGSGNGNAPVLTAEELDAIKKVSTLVTKEKAIELCKSIVPGIDSTMKITGTHLVKDQVNKERYIWEINFDGAYVTLNATTGSLLSFYINQRRFS